MIDIKNDILPDEYNISEYDMFDTDIEDIDDVVLTEAYYSTDVYDAMLDAIVSSEGSNAEFELNNNIISVTPSDASSDINIVMNVNCDTTEMTVDVSSMRNYVNNDQMTLQDFIYLSDAVQASYQCFGNIYESILTSIELVKDEMES